MDKETLSNSDETEEEYRPGRSSILKPQRPRTPFQEVTFRSVTEEFDLTNRRRRVSFANVNIVKEFCSKTESQHIGSIEPYEETFSVSTDSSHNSNSLLSKNSTGFQFISPGKQESPNSSVYNDEMELTSNSICEPNIFIQNPQKSEDKSETKYSFPSMENTCADKECTEANMSMTNVLNFHYQIPDKENLYKRNYLEMSDMELTEAIPMKVTNRTLNFPKDHQSSVMEFTEIHPPRLMINNAPTLEDQCQDLSIEDKKSKRKPRKTLTCDEIEEKLPSKEMIENQNVSVDMSLVTTGFTGLNKWSFKPNHKNDPEFNTQDESLDMSMVTASSIALHKANMKPLQSVNDNLVKSTKNNDLVNIASGRKSIKPFFNFKDDDDDMNLLSSSSAVLNRLSVKPQEILTKIDESPQVRIEIEPSYKDDMSLVTTGLNRRSFKPNQKNDPTFNTQDESQDMSLVTASSIALHKANVKPLQSVNDNLVKSTKNDDLVNIASGRKSIKPSFKDDDDDMNLLSSSSAVLNRLSVQPQEILTKKDESPIKPSYKDDMSLVTTGFTGLNKLSFKPNQKNDPAFNTQDESLDMSMVTTSSIALHKANMKPLQSVNDNLVNPENTNLIKSTKHDDLVIIAPERKSIKPSFNFINLLSSSSPVLNTLSVEPQEILTKKDESPIKPSYKDDMSLITASDLNSVKYTNDESMNMNLIVSNSKNRLSIKPDNSVNLLTNPATRLSINPFLQEDSIEEQDSVDLVYSKTLSLNRRKSIKPFNVDDPEDIQNVSADMSLAEGIPDHTAPRLNPVEKDDSTDNQDEDHILPTARKSIKPNYNDSDNNLPADMSLANSSDLNIDSPVARLSVYPVEKDDSAENKDESDAQILPTTRKSIKSIYNENDVSADICLTEVKNHDDHRPSTRLSIYLKDDSVVDNQDESDAQILPIARKSIKPFYNDPENDVSADINLAEVKNNDEHRLTTRLSIYPKDDSVVDNQDESDAQILPTTRKSIKSINNENDVSADISLTEVKNHDDHRPTTRLSIYPKDDSIVDESSDLVFPASRKSMKPNISTDENIVTGSTELRVKSSKLSIVQKDDSIPNIQDVSLPPEPSFSTHSEKDLILSNEVQNISMAMSLLPAHLSRSHKHSEYRNEYIFENSLMPGVTPLSPERSKQSFMHCEEEIDNENDKISIKYDDLEPVSFGQKSIIPMELNDSSVIDDDDDEKPQEPTSEKPQDLEMCISPDVKEIKNKTLKETATETPKSKNCPEFEMCITPEKDSNINSKTPKSTVSKTPKSKNSEVNKLELYNLKMKSIKFMDKLGFEWMTFLEWKLEIFDHFYLGVEICQTDQIKDATRINKLYFFRGPYVRQADIVDFVENNFRTNFPNLQCSIIGNIKKIVDPIISFWKEQEPMIKSMLKLRRRYPFEIEDQNMTFTIDDIEKQISFDVTINLAEWRTGIKNEHISVTQYFGTVSEHLVKFLWKPEVDFFNYVLDLQKYVFLNP